MKIVLGIVAGLLIVVALILRHVTYVPQPSLDTALLFVQSVVTDKMADAYALTRPRGAYGPGYARFEDKVCQQFGIQSWPVDRAVKSLGIRSPLPSYWTCVADLLRGRNCKPATVKVLFDVGNPLTVELQPGTTETWRVTDFRKS